MQFLATHWGLILDTAAKLAIIGAAFGLWCMLRQYKRSVGVAERNERRASVELAAREAARYGATLLPQIASLRAQIESSGCEFLQHCKVKHEVIDGQDWIKTDDSAVTPEDLEALSLHKPEITRVLNSLEGFAIPFAANVADNKIGLIACARSFVGMFEENFPLFNRHQLLHYYPATQNLYWRWRAQLAEEGLLRKHALAGKELLTLTETVIRSKSKSKAALACAALLRSIADRISKSGALG